VVWSAGAWGRERRKRAIAVMRRGSFGIR